MKESSEGDPLPLSLSKKDASNNASNRATSPPLVSSSLAPTAPQFLTASLSPAMLAALNAEVSAVAVGHHATVGGEVALADNNGGGKLPRGPKDTVGGGPRDKVFVCSVCHRCFGYKHVLQNHERTHTGEKPFECKECHKRFTRDHHLKTHMRLHTGEKPYHCTHCERQFVQVANLRRHLRVHTGERPYACELCTSRFSDSNQLKAHMLIHKGEKPFECKQCMGRFRRRHHLMHHKCPKDESNIGKPRRGRRPKTAEDLEREARQLPTVVPEQRPKRERKPRETRRIIKVMTPIMMTTGEGSCYAMASPYGARPPPPPLSPPEQTEPEDLSMHSSDNGDRVPRPLQQPPRPSSVPLAVGTGGVHPLKAARARTPPSRVLMVDDDAGSESEAMVEEEEEDEDETDDAGSCVSPRRIRLRGRECDDDADELDDELDDVDEDEMMSEGLMEGDDEDSEDMNDEDVDERRIRDMEVENNGGAAVSSIRSKARQQQQQQLHHAHCHPRHRPPMHTMHHPHHHHHHAHHAALLAHPLGMARGAAAAGRPSAIALVQHAMPHNNKMGKDDENGDGRC